MTGRGWGGGVTFEYRSGIKLGDRVSVYTGYRDLVFTTLATDGSGDSGTCRSFLYLVQSIYTQPLSMPTDERPAEV